MADGIATSPVQHSGMPEPQCRTESADGAVPPPPSADPQSLRSTVPRARGKSDRTPGRRTLTQSVAPRTGVITVHGTVCAAGARLVSDTVEALRREGHQRVVLHLAGADRIDDDGLAVLHSCRSRVQAGGGALHIFGEPGPDDSSAAP